MKKGYSAIAVFITAVMLFSASNAVTAPAFKREKDIKYYSLSSPKLILEKGPEGAFDSKRTHTMSIVELNKDGYKYWAYYHGFNGTNIKHDMGLAYSNDLENWVKEESNPIIPDLRWGTVVVVDGIVNMFGTRNYGGDSYIVRLSSEDGKNFKEEETAVAPVKGEKNQNPFIFYDDRTATYRLYYYHFEDGKCYIEEKHSKDIAQVAKAEANKVLSDDEFILAAPSMMFKDGKYWLAAETLHEVKGRKVWKTIMFSSRHPYKGFFRVDNHEILVDSDACYFQHIFDNRLVGVYSHEYADGTWEIFKREHPFKSRTDVEMNEHKVSLNVRQSRQLTATASINGGEEKDVTGAATWAISDNKIASVRKGKIIAKNAGKVTVTASYGGDSEVSEIEIK